MSNNPLVSVCIITYNSADYIIEALDSVAAQTYNNIELIVSDDASKDNTVEVCKSWFATHEARFVRAELITVEKNTGVSANANRALRNCRGEWIKYFAGDDKLLPNCIDDDLSYVYDNPETELLFSDMLCFSVKHTQMELSSRKIYFEFLTPLQFKVHLLIQNFLPAPSNFMKKELFFRLGGFDENIPMMEDKPFFIKVLYSNSKMNYMAIPTVCYRISEQSISQCQTSHRVMNRFEESREKARQLMLEKIKDINCLLYVYQRNEYNYQFNPTFYTKLLHGLRFLNPAYYYIQYIFLKVRVISHWQKQ